jgi:hypothetical protein
MDTLDHPDGTTWVLFTWPMLALLLLLVLLAGTILGGLIERARPK